MIISLNGLLISNHGDSVTVTERPRPGLSTQEKPGPGRAGADTGSQADLESWSITQYTVHSTHH